MTSCLCNSENISNEEATYSNLSRLCRSSNLFCRRIFDLTQCIEECFREADEGNPDPQIRKKIFLCKIRESKEKRTFLDANMKRTKLQVFPLEISF